MGKVRVDVLLVNEGDLLLSKMGRMQKSDVRSLKINALVDTGAVMVLLPQDVVETLGLGKVEKAIVVLANEEKIEMDVMGPIALTIANRRMTTDCLMGPPRCESLIGQLVLERLDLVIDPLKHTLTPRPESPYLPLLKLK